MSIATPKTGRRRSSLRPDTKYSPASLFFLAKDHWSPRFGPTFFTTKVISNDFITSQDSQSILQSHSSLQKLKGRTNLPACYYTIEISYGHSKHTCLRRYSQFDWLYKELLSKPLRRQPSFHQHDGGDNKITSIRSIAMPPKTCQLLPFCNPSSGNSSKGKGDNKGLEEIRRIELDKFLVNLLQMPGYANHEAVVEFLELSKVCRHVAEQSKVSRRPNTVQHTQQ